MVSVSNNSVITNQMAIAIAEGLSPEDFNKFKTWLRLVETESISKVNQSKNRINRFG